jgi:hypothetical protein
VSEELQDLLRAEMERVPASPRADLVREAHQSQRRRQQARRRASLTATVAATAAVATVVALQPGASRPGTGAATGPSGQAAAPGRLTLGGAGGGVQTTTAAPVTVKLTAETGTTVASVLDKAAQASASGNLQLVNGWPTVPYWHTLTQWTGSDCPGQVRTSNTWLREDGREITGDKVTGPQSSSIASVCFDGATGGYALEESLPGARTEQGMPPGPDISAQHYSWAQFAALPTDPEKLWQVLVADSKVKVPGTAGAATVGGAPSNADELDGVYGSVIQALINYPVSPAMRVALFKVMEKFPRVHVTGKYTDSLGRTGTAITFTAPPPPKGVRFVGDHNFTDVIDPGTGQLLAQLDAAQPVPPGCVRATVGGNDHASCVVGGADTQVFISAGPASTQPLHFTTVTMPSVVGESITQAEPELVKAGFTRGVELKVGRTPTRGTRTFRLADKVVAQWPAAGAKVPVGPLDFVQGPGHPRPQMGPVDSPILTEG